MKTLTNIENNIYYFFQKIILGLGIENPLAKWVQATVLLLISIIICYILWWAVRKILIKFLGIFIDKSKTKWDDYLIENNVFSAIAHLFPILIFDDLMKITLADFPQILNILNKVLGVLIIVVVLIIILRVLSTFEKILSTKEQYKDKPLQSIFQLSKIIIIAFMFILGLSIATGLTPLYFLTSLGAMTAIILLIFKDTILGFVGSMQLAANDMVKIGDWITMNKYGADGNVIEMTLATVKVQNFDKTITTIPTYSFISDSFKNWRGMEQSAGRRIKRVLNIEINTVKFCDKTLLNSLSNIDFLKDRINLKTQEINEYNKKQEVDVKYLINGRNQTNIGLFRYYIEAYLKNNPFINSDMTLMVRQLPSTAMGIPIEVYCFSKEKEWVVYENIVADIFDHLMAATQYFDLKVFERPSGRSIQLITK